MNCDRCNQPIRKDGGPEDGLRIYNPSPTAPSGAAGKYHFRCMRRPEELENLQFRQWATWTIRNQQQMHQDYKDEVEARLERLERPGRTARQDFPVYTALHHSQEKQG